MLSGWKRTGCLAQSQAQSRSTHRGPARCAPAVDANSTLFSLCCEACDGPFIHWHARPRLSISGPSRVIDAHTACKGHRCSHCMQGSSVLTLHASLGRPGARTAVMSGSPMPKGANGMQVCAVCVGPMSVGCLVTSPTLLSASLIRTEKAHTRRNPPRLYRYASWPPRRPRVMFDKTCKRLPAVFIFISAETSGDQCTSSCVCCKLVTTALQPICLLW